MITEPYHAHQLDEGDHFVECGEEFRVKSLESDTDYMDFIVTEVATGDDYPMTFAPFDVVQVVMTHDEPEPEVDVPIED